MNRLHSEILICLLPALCLLHSCSNEPSVGFSAPVDLIEAGAEGKTVEFSLSSGDSWVAKTQDPWITVSPANGNGSTVCTVSIDSALTFSPREGLVRFEQTGTGERRDIRVTQKGFEYAIDPLRPEISLQSYAPFGERTFEVDVMTNLPFRVEIPEQDASWLSCGMTELQLDRGARPRKVTLRFEWDLNYNQTSRASSVRFIPLEEGKEPVRNDGLVIRQEAAEAIEPGVKGDSLALLAIRRSLGCLSDYEVSEKMEHWEGVTVWKSGPDKGRVRSASFMLFSTDEGIPFQVKYLTACEELTFFSNANTFLKSLDPGPHICTLTRLRRLDISAYGLVSLPEEFTALKNLEYLNLSGNNFSSVPAILTPENFPNLHSLVLNANQRQVVYDLSNTVKKDLGGLMDESLQDADGNRTFPKRLLRWDALDTLILSVNYLQGSLPSLEDDPDFPKWTRAEVDACDTLPQRLAGLPKVLPHTTLLTINLNRLTGALPDWLLYHPCLDLWMPESLIFPQEGKDEKGSSCGFTNVPASLDYYYEEYVNKKFNPNNQGDKQ